MAASIRIVICGALVALAPLLATQARADGLAKECRKVDRTREAECEMKRPRGREWVLETSVQVGTGRKSAVEAVEERFCQAARQAGVRARVLRRSELPGAMGSGARMEWRCEPPAVSAAPSAAKRRR